MLTSILSISDFTIKVIAGVSGLLLGLILLMVLIFHKKNDKDD